jgi:hypothetical protein
VVPRTPKEKRERPGRALASLTVAPSSTQAAPGTPAHTVIVVDRDGRLVGTCSPMRARDVAARAKGRVAPRSGLPVLRLASQVEDAGPGTDAAWPAIERQQAVEGRVALSLLGSSVAGRRIAVTSGPTARSGKVVALHERDAVLVAAGGDQGARAAVRALRPVLGERADGTVDPALLGTTLAQLRDALEQERRHAPPRRGACPPALTFDDEAARRKAERLAAGARTEVRASKGSPGGEAVLQRTKRLAERAVEFEDETGRKTAGWAALEEALTEVAWRRHPEAMAAVRGIRLVPGLSRHGRMPPGARDIDMSRRRWAARQSKGTGACRGMVARQGRGYVVLLDADLEHRPSDFRPEDPAWRRKVAELLGIVEHELGHVLYDLDGTLEGARHGAERFDRQAPPKSETLQPFEPQWLDLVSAVREAAMEHRLLAEHPDAKPRLAAVRFRTHPELAAQGVPHAYTLKNFWHLRLSVEAGLAAEEELAATLWVLREAFGRRADDAAVWAFERAVQGPWSKRVTRTVRAVEALERFAVVSVQLSPAESQAVESEATVLSTRAVAAIQPDVELVVSRCAEATGAGNR